MLNQWNRSERVHTKPRFYNTRALQQNFVPEGTPPSGEKNFIFQQDNNPKHTVQTCTTTSIKKKNFHIVSRPLSQYRNLSFEERQIYKRVGLQVCMRRWFRRRFLFTPPPTPFPPQGIQKTYYRLVLFWSRDSLTSPDCHLGCFNFIIFYAESSL